MGAFSIENQGAYTYLVYEIDKEDTVDTLSLGMITNNKIPGVAQTVYTQMDYKKILKYNISSKVSGTQFFNGLVSKKRVLGVFRSIAEGLMAVEDYMIPPESLPLDMDHLYIDVSSCEVALICIPIVSEETKETNFNLFFKNIMFTAQFDPAENCDYVAKIINHLNASLAFSIGDFLKMLEGLMGQKPGGKIETPRSSQVLSSVTQPPEPPKPPVQKQEKRAEMPQRKNALSPQEPVKEEENQISWFYLMQHYNKDNAAAYKAQKAKKAEKKKIEKESKKGNEKVKKKKGKAQENKEMKPLVEFEVPVGNKLEEHQGWIGEGRLNGASQAGTPAFRPQSGIQQQAGNFGETTVLSSETAGETTVLSEAVLNSNGNPYLLRAKNNEKIYINKPEFRIGKEKKFADYCILGNTTISRNHANIILREGQVYVVDTNSTNHTFLNGSMIQSNVETMLEHNDKIRLANEEFELRLY